jgi:hypothetical protein
MAQLAAAEPRLGPLDPFVIAFLRWLAGRPAGFSPTGDAATIAAALAWPAPFVQVIFVSSRVRRFVAPAPRVGRPSPARWTITEQGRRWLAELGRSAD